ncbi:MAG: GxGYxYP domain-containing protein [Armatimonadota bacterium]
MKTYHLLSLENVAADEWPIAVSLQGLVNRESHNIYLLPSSKGMEKHWVEWYKQYGYEPVETNLDELLGKYVDLLKGYIVFDPSVPDTINVAASLAGVMDALICPPSVADRINSLGLKCLLDMRGRFEGRVEPYHWLVNEHLKDFDLRVMANYDQKETAAVQPDMDYLIAHRGFCMGLSINAADFPEEAAVWEQVQTAAPSHAMMLGWHTPRDSEATHVYFASRHSVWVYCGYARNTSFHQHIKASAEYSQDHCHSAECDPNGKYAAITLSDGDSWHSMCDVQKKFWLHPRRGEVPLGWEVAPIFEKVGPAVLEYYFKTKSDNDYIVSGPSGIAYNYPSGFADLPGYLKISADAMKKTSLKSIWAINRIVRHLPGRKIEHKLKNETVVYTREQMEEFGGPKDQKGADFVDDEVIAKYMEAMPDALGFFQGWERIPGEEPHWCDGRLWSPGSALVRKDVDGAIREFEESAARQSGPVFVCAHVNCYDADMDAIIETVRRLEDKGFTVVRPDVYLRLAQDAYARGLVGKH